MANEKHGYISGIFPSHGAPIVIDLPNGTSVKEPLPDPLWWKFLRLTRGSGNN